MKRFFLYALPIFIFVFSLTITANNSYAINLDLPDIPGLPDFPKKKEPPRLNPTSTPVPEPTKEEKPTTEPVQPTLTTTPVEANSTAAPAGDENVGGNEDSGGEEGGEVSQPAGRVISSGVGEIKALAATSGEDNLELIVVATGVVFALSGVKLLWPRETRT